MRDRCVHAVMVLLVMGAACDCESGTGGAASTGGGSGGATSGSGGATGGTGACAAPSVACDGACVDLQTDINHCGSCDNPCTATESCCAGECYDLEDSPFHCGSCDNACPPGIACIEGVCDCSSLIQCAAACVDPKSDSKNCGACGHDCEGAVCLDGLCQPQILASSQPMPNAVAVDAQNVYFTNILGVQGKPGDVRQVPLAGGSTSTLWSGGTPEGVVADAAWVYFTNAAMTGTVSKVPIGGGTATPLSSPAQGGSGPQGIALDAGNVYWTENGTVMKASKSGGAPVTIASGQGNPLAIAVDANNVYWTNYSGGEVMQAALGGGTPIALATMGKAQPSFLALDATTVYFTTAEINNGAVMKVPKGGGALTKLAPEAGQNLGKAQGIAVDASGVYWADEGYGVIYRLSPGSTTPVALVTGLLKPHAVVLDAAHVYFTCAYGGGSVNRIPK